jgi:hypothetical protein
MGELKNTYKMLIPKLKTRDHMKDIAVNGRNILKWIFKERGCKGNDWIQLTQDRIYGWAHVNMVIIFWIA